MKNIIKQVASAALIAGISTSSFAALVGTVDEATPGSKLTFAQQSETKKVNITYNVLSTIIGTLAGSIEFKVSQPFSVGFTGSYWFSHERKAEINLVLVPVIALLHTQA